MQRKRFPYDGHDLPVNRYALSAIRVFQNLYLIQDFATVQDATDFNAFVGYLSSTISPWSLATHSFHFSV